MNTHLRSKAPFSHLNPYSRREKADVRQSWKACGLSEFPLFFNSVLAVASDVDSADRRRQAAYCSQLTHTYGLDFGDSIWLHHMDGAWKYETMGFLDAYPTENELAHAGPADRAWLQDHLLHYHSGHLDHWHGILRGGGGGFLLDEVERSGHVVKSELRQPVERFWKGLLVYGVVFNLPAGVVPPENVWLEAEGETSQYVKKPSRFPDVVWSNRCQLYEFDDSGGGKPPFFEDTRFLTTEFHEPAENVGPFSATLVSHHRPGLLSFLSHLRQTYHVEFGCITAHGGGLFYNDVSLKYHTDNQAAKIRDENDFLPVLKANFTEEGHFFSAVIDEPSSHMFAWPELVRELEVRFVNPSGLTAAPDQYFDLFDLVTPSLTRCKAGVFTGRRSMPTLDESSGYSEKQRRGSRHSTFTARLGKALGELGRGNNSGQSSCALYTHLGNIKACPPSASMGPFPTWVYDDPNWTHLHTCLSPEALQDLQDRALNMSGTQPGPQRTWFTRLSVLYDYAYVMPRLPDHTTRCMIDGLDVVSIQSWEEPTLGKTYPISPSQLYGVTFQADDTDAVRIFLDGEEIEHLVRIPPKGGRPGLVMIASTDLSIPCTNELLAMGPVGTVEGENACLTWDPSAQSDAIDEVHAPMLTVESDPNISRKRKRGFLGLRKRTSSKEAPGVSLKREDASSIPNGRLTVAGAGLGTVRWELRGRSFDGCQQLAIRLRSDQEGLEFCIKIMTADGGLFAFHSPGFEPPADATATFTSLPLHSGRWHTLVVPFCELDWKKLPQGIAPLPMKDVESIELSVVNPADTPVTLDLDHIDFERPRATRIAVQSSTHVLVGDTETVDTHPFIHLQSASQTTETLTTRATFHGAFVFTDLATGVYRLWSTASEAPDSEVGKELFVHVRNDSSLVSLQ